MQKICSICQGVASLKHQGFPGYQEGLVYDIYECDSCETSFADPLKTDEKVYDFMYQSASKLVGYERYYRYFESVKLFRNPLAYLKTTEPSYWSVITQIQKNTKPKNEIKILEIGSGLGYVTKSLRASGYNAFGIDVSSEAVKIAKESFGDFYQVEDLFLKAQNAERFDYVLMMDVIEHVENPVAFVEAALKLVAEGGELLITTPNKSSAPRDISVWQSDAPPVHLWFMAEKTLKTIASLVSASCEFVDFSSFNSRFYTPVYTSSITELSKSLPRLNSDGSVHSNGLVLPGRRNLLGLKMRYLIAYLRRRLMRKNLGAKTTIMCAVLKKI